jgi:hypothetical protein
MANSTDEMLVQDMASFYASPLDFVMYAFDWENDQALHVCELQEPWASRYGSKHGPDKWACEFMDQVGEEVRARGFDGQHAVPPIRFSTASGHGIGKSCLTSWICLWILSTRPHAKGVITANTAPQLETKTFAELAKWTRRCVNRHWWNITTGKGSLKITHKDYPESWRCDALTSREENSESFAGLHAAGATPFVIMDEASAIPDKIFEVMEGSLTDGEPMVYLFGNPTRNSGVFYDTFHRQRHRWITRQIDSRSVQITNKELIGGWIEDHGLTSDFVKVRVLGQFPSMSSNQFISVADVDAARGRFLRPEQYSWAPLIIGVDPSWTGEDEFVICARQGLSFQILRVIQKNDNDVEMANLIARLEDEHQAAAVFIDAGYGTGIVSVGNSLGRNWLLVWFGEKAHNPGYFNRRSEIWGAVRDWLKAGGSIPPDPVLYADLIGPETVPRPDGKIQLESKIDMKRRKVPSPNRADALAITFAFPVQAKSLRSVSTPSHAARDKYDPYAKRKRDPYRRRA